MKNEKSFSVARAHRMVMQGPTSSAQAAGGLHASVVQQIGMRIVQGEFLPGEVLPTADDSSEMLGVSRTVLREAIKVLAGKGLVESRPKTGTRVLPRTEWNFLDPDVLAWRYAGPINPGDVRALFELRRAIEPMSASLAAERATPEQVEELFAALSQMEAVGDDGEQFAKPDLVFHQTILRMTGNELMGSLAALIETALMMSFRPSNDNPRGQVHSLPLHREVAERIAARDAVGAQRALMVLLDNAEEDVRLGVENLNRKRSRRGSVT
ncbi:MAG: FadR family transcriptional regulator [Alphaproteobacteria bacterium]|nr:FadR family transcriptional regulator [Alphaproteobacteria bacterium]MBU0802841.1 FadR family transcriptional regulator [Alphaproteobacteria bacterium]MBU0871638.1 FadR family transcriptional regulator [Alphaproteobacteria bacterium]MBU1400305.1 FadR family transcriptional regulator [Alphaproteobacteria bacterium]MBU1591425.1 FadR family transcriptional regulator [Alphaproteobacteria bacterium]